jgi:hypothetical protein
MSGSSERRLKFRGVLFPSRGLAEYWRECRGRGYCRIAMEAAEAFASSQMGVNFLLLFCRPALQSFYEHLGWTNVATPVWAEQAEGTVLLPLISMVKCLGAERWPMGEVRLGSRPW